MFCNGQVNHVSWIHLSCISLAEGRTKGKIPFEQTGTEDSCKHWWCGKHHHHQLGNGCIILEKDRWSTHALQVKNELLKNVWNLWNDTYLATSFMILNLTLEFKWVVMEEGNNVYNRWSLNVLFSIQHFILTNGKYHWGWQWGEVELICMIATVLLSVY